MKLTSPEQTALAVEGLVADAQRLLGGAPGQRIAELAGRENHLVVLHAITNGILEELDTAGRTATKPLIRLAVRALDLRVEIHERITEHRVALNEQVTEALRRLRGVRSTAELLDGVCVEVVHSCGVRRALLSRIEDGVWYPWRAHFPGDAGVERAFQETLRGGAVIKLDDAPVERAVIASHAAQIVHDASPPRAYGPLIGVSRSRAYVVAPITSAGRVVGLLHADHFPDPTPVDEVDRDVIWAFADGFARIYERTELSERLSAQREHVGETLDLLDAITSSVVAADIELTRDAAMHLAAADPLVSGPVRTQRAVEELLTEREREVLSLMALGRSNSAISKRLVIREGTVKSHVKHILRKLGAANRAEVISLTLGRGER
jgi:DNA-binding CsgD family transcriptional regulator